MDMQVLELAGTWIAFTLTLMVFSFLLGDNALYRLAEHLFVGVSVGYAAVVVFHNALAPKLLIPIADSLRGGDWQQLQWLLIPLGLGFLLLTKSFKWAKPVSWLGSFSVALLLGVGAALAIAGALVGTLLPQIDAASDLTHYVPRYGLGLGLFSGAVALVGTTGVLLHFYFGASREGRLGQIRTRLVRAWGGLGRWFVFAAFGALLAGAFVSQLSLLVARVQFLLDTVRGLFGG